jgi:ABC-type lipoprotein export system ATPase subunit
VALRGLSLEVAEGELLVVFGPSGSGKTTLLRILAGLDKPSAGTVRVFGRDLRTLRGRALAEYRRRTLGYADQHYDRALAPELTARAFVALRLALAGMGRREREAEADRLLERVGLRDRAGALPGELSGGQQQRLAICAALAHRPRLFIADEPTGELDAASAAQVYALIRELGREAGATTVLVSHDARSADVADRVLQIRDGRVSSELAGGVTQSVVNRGGWLRLPEELLGGAERVRVGGGGGEITVLLAAPAARTEAEPVPALEPGPTVARTEGLAMRYRAVEVFADLGLELAAGALTVITGPSGSGKSTLLHLLAGLRLPSSGDVDVLGRRLGELGAGERAAVRRSAVGFVAQGSELVPFLTARETVELALALRGASREDAVRRAATALAEVGLAQLAGQRVARLSAGERQRVAVARAVAARPALLLADEPTARLDEANARSVASLLRRLARTTGAAVAVATHDPLVIEQADATVALG